MVLGQRNNIPPGLKPQILRGSCGTAEAVPFQDPIYATSSTPEERDAIMLKGAGALA